MTVKKNLTILIIDDHALFRTGMRILLSQTYDPAGIHLAQDGKVGLELCVKLNPDLILTDIDMPRMDGFELLQKIRCRGSKAKVIVISMYQGGSYVEGMLKAKADGYLLKDTPPDELLKAIQLVFKGETYVSFKLTQGLAPLGKERQLLTPREKEVLGLIAAGKTSKEIATQLGLSHRTVESHRANMMVKLSVDNLAELLRYAIERRIGE